jgi:hypothetical protein
MGTGLTWDFAATIDRGILQRAHDSLDEEKAKNSGNHLMALSPTNRLMSRSSSPSSPTL